MSTAHFSFENSLGNLRDRLLAFTREYTHCAFLDSHFDSAAVVPLTGIHYDLLVAVGSTDTFTASADGLDGLDYFIDRSKGKWVFGHLSYDVKNGIEKLSTNKKNRIGFEEICFFVPETVIAVQGSRVSIYAQDPEKIWNMIQEHSLPEFATVSKVQLNPRISRKEYLDAVTQVIRHIIRGDIYELNYCHEYYSDNADIDPLSVFKQLSRISPNPFSGYYRNGESHLMCASPERFLNKTGSKILSQPIKGTARRDSDSETDGMLKRSLQEDAKERSENVMIVDLVRNDLSRVAERGSVKVEELFGVYTFPGAHQMISSVSCSLNEDVLFSDIIKAAFPMGSMTGAPKVRAMQLIDELEQMRRGLFSGSIGFISPEGDFDFNVVIRNIQYNAGTGYLSVMAGGAITAASDPAKEYDETILKLSPQFRVLGYDHLKQVDGHA
jgi:para-aminobenzoate synthetase component I